MFFTGPIWLSILLPIVFAPVLLIASLAIRPGRARRLDKSAFLSAAGLALALIGGGAWLAAVLAGLVLVMQWIGLRIERASAHGNGDAADRAWSARAWLIVAVAVNVIAVVAILRAGLLAGPWHGVTSFLVPVGVSYFALHGISYAVAIDHRRVAANRSRSQLAVYSMLLPLIVGGPLNYERIAPQLARGWPGLSDYSYGVRRLVIGVWKVFVVAGIAGQQADMVFAQRPGQLSALLAWVGLVGFTLQIYYVFSGYADMGVGCARMLGLRVPENFRWPYVAQTVSEFWARWHLGLTAWFRENVVQSPALVVLLCAMWYGVGWTFVAWGLYHAMLLIVERAGVEAAVKRWPSLLRHLYLILVVMIGWVILRSQTLGDAALFLKALAGLNPPSLRPVAEIDRTVWVVLVAGAIGCAPLSQAIRRWTVAIDALILSLLMLMSAPILFTWRCGVNVATPVRRWWRE